MASVSLFIGFMNWFGIRPGDVGRAMRKVAPLSEPLGIIVMSIAIVVVGNRTILEWTGGDIPWGRLVSLAIIISSFLWSSAIILSRQKNKT